MSSKLNLKRLTKPLNRKGPLLIIIMDGVGLGNHYEGDMVFHANTPVLDDLMASPLYMPIFAHGTAVGLPSDDDMGNSEVGHNAIGAGRIFDQGAKLVNNAIETKAMFQGQTWKKLIANVKSKNSTLHFIGLLSDGNVHSHIKHLKEMIHVSSEEGVQKLRVHALLDGRDVGETSALDYFEDLENFLNEFKTKNLDYRIASGGGRMKITMDRYEADWNMIKLGWETHVMGKGRLFNTSREAIETLRNETGAIDQFLDPFVIGENGSPVGKIVDGDSVIFFNFRGDRAIEISRAFEEADLTKFQREYFPKVEYAGMMEYDGDLHVPKQYLVSPPAISETMGDYLVQDNMSLFAISETQKYGHVTYFWNGNRSGKFSDSLEEYIEIPSDNVAFEQRPWMKAAEITDKTIELLLSKRFRTGRLNYANGDMVGHTGDADAARIAVETVDWQIKRILNVIKRLDGIAIVTADHGNADEMYELDKKGNAALDKATGRRKAKTSHTLNPVPFCIYDPGYQGEYEMNKMDKPGLSNIAATAFNLLGYEAPQGYRESLIKFK